MTAMDYSQNISVCTPHVGGGPGLGGVPSGHQGIKEEPIDLLEICRTANQEVFNPSQ
jgi:glycine cleavage system protein P-like pyridoxal-binding family